MTRAALFAAGAVLSATGCGESHRADAGRSSDATVADSGAVTDAGVDSGAAIDAGTDAGFDAGEIALPYGAPPVDHLIDDVVV